MLSLELIIKNRTLNALIQSILVISQMRKNWKIIFKKRKRKKEIEDKLQFFYEIKEKKVSEKL